MILWLFSKHVLVYYSVISMKSTETDKEAVYYLAGRFFHLAAPLAGESESQLQFAKRSFSTCTSHR